MLEQASIIRQKRQTIKITISDSGELVVYCPFGVSYTKIEQILESKKTLLEKKINRAKHLSQKYSKIMNKESILLFGREYLIVPTTKVKKACFSDEYFVIPKKYIESGKIDFQIKKIIKEIAERVITRRVKDILSYYKEYDVSKIIIGGFRSKWGSCDNFAVVKLNWRLAMLPPKIIDFVIYHELTHLKELNHSRRFYTELQKVCPTWKESRDELKNFSFILSLYE